MCVWVGGGGGGGAGNAIAFFAPIPLHFDRFPKVHVGSASEPVPGNSLVSFWTKRQVNTGNKVNYRSWQDRMTHYV